MQQKLNFSLQKFLFYFQFFVISILNITIIFPLFLIINFKYPIFKLLYGKFHLFNLGKIIPEHQTNIDHTIRNFEDDF